MLNKKYNTIVLILKYGILNCEIPFRKKALNDASLAYGILS